MIFYLQKTNKKVFIKNKVVLSKPGFFKDIFFFAFFERQSSLSSANWM